MKSILIKSILIISLISIFILSLMSVLLPVSANPGNNRYYVFSTDAKLKADLGVFHEFPNAFSTKLATEQVVRLKEAGIIVEPVSVFEILESSVPEKPLQTTTRKSTPTDQTPWGIEKVYNNSTIISTFGGENVDVAVLDSGVFKDHLDLTRRVKDCKDFTGRGVKAGCRDSSGHGTHVAGTILADAGSDGKGIYGVAPQANLFAYKVCNAVCFGDDIADAINYSANNGAEIISMSFGGPSLSQVEQDAIDYAVGKGLLLIAAAGNSGPDLDTIGYPAAYVKVVAVAAINSTDAVTDFSSRGNKTNAGDYIIQEREVEVATPGSRVESTWNNGGYRFASGTSMATPHVSGLAAKFWSSVTADLNGDGIINGADVRIFIQERAKLYDITKGQHSAPGDDPASGFGLPTVPP